ncbi:hypothetical protein [Bradyrhizobium sp. Ash2021]|uniref:hypothetical protein n=1 Tax=Bradyrhizobium sp. Ash2021 TaxID=2954771 RepID=UPI0028154580|nr:hypothetical protein [Bradyrhizobium sp. Ash2021]WMT75546.1 hypothetical protein NL528_03745 [Bradyrhizobium sp. Ash2021]
MPNLSGKRKRVAIWVLVKLFLSLCGGHDDAPAAIALDQPLALAVAQTARQSAKNHVP